MAKRKKPASKVPSRRSARRGKQVQTANITEGETSTSIESAPEASTEENPPDAPNQELPNQNEKNELPSEEQKLKTGQINLTPVVALHKKFGKYRCLFNSDDRLGKKYDIGSDSETNSSIEIRIVDPCASSESDAALDNQSDTNSGACSSPLTFPVNSSQVNSREMSPALVENSQEDDVIINKIQDDDISNEVIKDTNLEKNNHEVNNDSEQVLDNLKDIVEKETEQTNMEKSPDRYEQFQDNDQEVTLEEHLEYGDDDEVITIVQIVEDDNQELYYNINIESPNETPLQQVENDVKDEQSEADIQNNFSKLNLTQLESNPNSPMDCSENVEVRTPPCKSPDPQILNDILIRPDPSLTPSSTLSDDSNSSRVTEQNPNNSNDSSESSPTGVRRSNRLKTISTMKQKTKGYGLVKTPLKKALITQTKLKLEEMGSDSQEKIENLQSNTPNTLTFPVPSEMPVKVKSRWRRSSELEMGANSPANSPLTSPGLPQKLPALEEVSKEPEEEPTVAPLSKEAYDKIIEERLNQYQHLEENEYLCDRMVSKETKKMICDCFMTKDELERGELACGEDCLNRLLMIEWYDFYNTIY